MTDIISEAVDELFAADEEWFRAVRRHRRFKILDNTCPGCKGTGLSTRPMLVRVRQPVACAVCGGDGKL